MTRDIISVNMPEVEPSQSIAYKEIAPFEVNIANGITIEKATENKNNSLSILIAKMVNPAPKDIDEDEEESDDQK